MAYSSLHRKDLIRKDIYPCYLLKDEYNTDNIFSMLIMKKAG